MKRIVQKFLPIFLLLLLLLYLYLLEHETRSKMKSYLTFDQVLNQELELNGELSEVIPRHDSIFFVETSGKNHFYFEMNYIPTIRGPQLVYLVVLNLGWELGVHN